MTLNIKNMIGAWSLVQLVVGAYFIKRAGHTHTLASASVQLAAGTLLVASVFMPVDVRLLNLAVLALVMVSVRSSTSDGTTFALLVALAFVLSINSQ